MNVCMYMSNIVRLTCILSPLPVYYYILQTREFSLMPTSMFTSLTLFLQSIVIFYICYYFCNYVYYYDGTTIPFLLTIMNYE